MWMEEVGLLCDLIKLGLFVSLWTDDLFDVELSRRQMSSCCSVLAWTGRCTSATCQDSAAMFTLYRYGVDMIQVQCSCHTGTVFTLYRYGVDMIQVQCSCDTGTVFMCHPRTLYLEQSTCWAMSCRHFTGCIQKRTEASSVFTPCNWFSAFTASFHSCMATCELSTVNINDDDVDTGAVFVWCYWMSPMLISTGVGHFGAKFVEEGVDWCKPNFSKLCRYLLLFEHNAQTWQTDRQTDRQTTER